MNRKASFLWKLRNNLRWSYIKGWVAAKIGMPIAGYTGLLGAVGELSAVHTKADGTLIDYGVLGRRVVTDAFVAFIVDQLQIVDDSQTLGNEDTFGFHDSGEGNTAEDASDTDIETTDGESRVEGTYTEGATGNIFKTVATISYTSTKAIVEHGVFSRTTSGTLMDRTVFSAINVVNGDSIQFTYQLTLSAGS